MRINAGQEGTMAHRSGAMLWVSVLALLVSLAVQAEVGASQLKPEYHKWLNEDVRWIITDQERHDFMKLATDDQRDQFVVDFWERRNPTPGSKTNAFKEEHYRRLAFANEHFAASKVPGWRTDRGRIYIVYGPPDSIQTHPAVKHVNGIMDGKNLPYEVWHYSHMSGIGDNENIKFVDICSCGDYRIAMEYQIQDE